MTHLDKIIIVLSVIGMFLHLKNDLKKDHKELSTKVDNLAAQVHELKETVSIILFLMRPGQAEPPTAKE